MMRYLAAIVVAAVAIAWAGDARKVDLTVAGMHCDHCTDKVKSALTKVQDVQRVEVELKKGTAHVELLSDSPTSTHMLAEAVADAGYGVTYQDGSETKTLDATKTHVDDKDCMHEGESKMECAKGAAMDCCAGKSSKAKVNKKK